MDWIRSCYKAPMVFREGDEPLQGQWYFCEEDASAFPYFHAFGSLNWLGNGWAGGDIGERPGPRPWQSGAKPVSGGDGDANAVECAEFHSDWWTAGLGEGEESGPYDSNGLPECCLTGPCTCHANRYAFIPCTITVVSGSCSGLQLSLILSRDSDTQCTWFGTGSSDLGDYSIRVTYDGSGNWSLDAWTCSDESAIVVSGPGTACPVGTVTWPGVSSNGLCCASGPTTFDVSVTVG